MFTAQMGLKYFISIHKMESPRATMPLYHALFAIFEGFCVKKTEQTFKSTLSQ